ncbi:MAG: hypothetical protein ACRDX9_02795 [Acidimicrobiia bacterium]
MERVGLSTGEWSVEGVMARTFGDRLLGVWRAPEGSAVVIATRSVHNFGRRRPLVVVGLDAGMRVVETKTLRPNRLVAFRSARIVIELPVGSPVPSKGDLVELTSG